MTQKTAFIDAEIKRITDLKNKSAKLIHYRATQRQLLAIERRQKTTKWIGFLVTILTTIVTFVIGNVLALKKKHPYAYAWWNGEKVKGATSGPGRDKNKKAYGYLRGPKPLGGTKYSIMCCAIAEEYPPLLGALSLMGICPTINRAGSIFLLTFAQRYFNELEGIHWNGNRDQLNYSQASTFIQSWDSWNVPQNYWRWLYPQEKDFSLSIAVHTAKKTWTDSYLESLFSGGLCNLVLNHTTTSSDADIMMQHLMGIKLVLFRSCEDERLHKAMQNACYAMMATGSTIALGQLTRSAYLKWGGQAAKGAEGAEAEEGAAEAAEGAEASEGAAAAAEGAAAAETATEAGAITTGSTIGTAAAAESAGTIGASVCGPAFVICAAIVDSIISIVVVSVLTVTACVVVGAATGAITYAKSKCKGGVYYILVDGNQIPWTGDISLLPKGAQHERMNAPGPSIS